MPAPNDVIEFSAVALSSVFFSVDPLGAIPAFMAMGADHDERSRRKAARRAAITCWLVLSLFGAAGTLIFKAFGITLPAFQIAGGLLLFQLAMQMLQARRSGTQESEEETAEGREKEDFGLFPLGIPMLAGPASISAVMVLMAQSRLWWQAIPVYAAIGVTALCSYWMLSGAMRVRAYLGATGMRVMVRMMGLVLAAMAVQFVINGVTDLWVSLSARPR